MSFWKVIVLAVFLSILIASAIWSIKPKTNGLTTCSITTPSLCESGIYGYQGISALVQKMLNVAGGLSPATHFLLRVGQLNSLIFIHNGIII